MLWQLLCYVQHSHRTHHTHHTHNTHTTLHTHTPHSTHTHSRGPHIQAHKPCCRQEQGVARGEETHGCEEVPVGAEVELSSGILQDQVVKTEHRGGVLAPRKQDNHRNGTRELHVRERGGSCRCRATCWVLLIHACAGCNVATQRLRTTCQLQEFQHCLSSCEPPGYPGNARQSSPLSPHCLRRSGQTLLHGTKTADPRSCCAAL